MAERNFRSKAEVDAYYEPEKVERDVRPKGFKAWWENYWYHHKWATIIVTFLVAVFVFTFIQFATRKQPDYIIMTAFDRFVPSEVTDVIASEFASYGEDINGDGEVIVEIYDVSTGSNSDTQQSNRIKMMCELQNGEVMLFIVDDTYFDTLSDLKVFETDPDLFTDKDSRAINLRDTKLTERINEVYPGYIGSDYYIAKRVVGGTSFEKVEKSVKSEKNSVAMLKKFKAAEVDG